jgi:lactaldehyde dehydrogenase/glycolaldehyde dehydrogenase
MSLLKVFNPITEDSITEVTLANSETIMQAIENSAVAQKKWSKLSSIGRSAHLHSLADSLLELKEKIGTALALESGKTVEDSIHEVTYAAEITRYHAEWARRIEGEVIPSDSPQENLTLHREPLGVVACLIPFNYPVFILLRKIAPALITGNTVIVRPSDHTPCSALEIAKAVTRAGMPDGVIQILPMSNEGAEILCTHKKVSMITMTGGVAAGRVILGHSQKNITKCSLELGGKTPAIIEPDADLKKAAQEVVASKLTHCGQLCTAVERVYIQKSIYGAFTQLLKENMMAVKQLGPLISSAARQRVHQMVERAVSEGAQLALGGQIPMSQKGFFYPPTLLLNCRQNMEIIQEETFGPVLSVLPYDTIEEALALANDHQFGLASVLYSENYRTIMKVSREIEAGELYVNRTPGEPYQGYHAGWKRSGLGGDDGKHGMLEFTQTRLVVMSY